MLPVNNGMQEESYDEENQRTLKQQTLQDPSHVDDVNLTASKQPNVVPKISKVPSHVKNRNLTAYEPKVVSIGPYHYGKPQLATMERHKQRALDKLVTVSNLTHQAFKIEIEKVVKTLKMSYADLDLVRWRDDDEFIQLMILDGCFLIEFLSGPTNYHKNYPETDPIFSARGHAINYNVVMQDLLMVENQLPYLALETLWSTSQKEIRQGGDVSSDVVFNAISQLIRRDVKEPGFHILETHMEGLLELGEKITQDNELGKLCASELYLFNVKFKKANSYKDMQFDKATGTLSLPFIIINERTASTYLNMVAQTLTLESPEKALLFTTYVRLMGTLVQSIKDVSLLQSRGIIINKLINHEAVVGVIQEIAKGTIYPH